MTNSVPTVGKPADWLAVLQESHRYIIHYSTVRLSLVTFLVTAMLTAILFGIPKETLKIDSGSVTAYSGDVNWPAIVVGIFFYIAAFLMNWIFDKRRYIMERFAEDIETILDAKITGQATTAREHHLDTLGPNDINTILSRPKDLESEYLEKFKALVFTGTPRLNLVITWAFIAVLVGLVSLIILSWFKANRLTTSYPTASLTSMTEIAQNNLNLQ